MGTAVCPAKTSPGPWDAFADVDVFVNEVLGELEGIARDGAWGRCDRVRSRRAAVGHVPGETCKPEPTTGPGKCLAVGLSLPSADVDINQRPGAK